MAVNYYGSRGDVVYVPISGDITRCDLVVDFGPPIGLLRVEVKTTTRDNGEVFLKTCGGNQTGAGKIKKLSADDCDLVFCVNLLTGGHKEFPITELEGRSTVRVR